MIHIEFVIIDGDLTPKVTGRKLDRNDARIVAMFASNQYFDDNCIDVLSRIIRKANKVAPNEKLMRRVIENIKPSETDMMAVSCEVIEKSLLKVEAAIDAGDEKMISNFSGGGDGKNKSFGLPPINLN